MVSEARREFDSIEFSGHAVERMFQRDLTTDDVRNVIESGEIIDEYPNDEPYPSQLMLGFVDSEPVHMVVASDSEARRAIVVTVYRPDPELWSDDFRTRRGR